MEAEVIGVDAPAVLSVPKMSRFFGSEFFACVNRHKWKIANGPRQRNITSIKIFIYTDGQRGHI